MRTETLTVAILGAGNIGGTLGRKWSAAGHSVGFGVSDPQGKKAQAVRAELGDRVRIGTVADALGINSEVVVMAMPGGAMDASGEDRAKVERLITDVGLHPMRLGDVDQVSLVDSVASLWFALALGQGKGRHLAFKVLGV